MWDGGEVDQVFATTLELDYLSHYIFRVWERTDSEYEELDPRRFRVEVSFSDGATVNLNDFHRARNVKRKSRNSATSSELLQQLVKVGQAAKEDAIAAKAEQIAEAEEEAGDTDDESDDETAASLRSDTDARASAKPKSKKSAAGGGAGCAAEGGAATTGHSGGGPLPTALGPGPSASAQNAWIMSPITQRTSFTLPLTAVKAALLVPAERWLSKKQEKQREKQRRKDEKKGEKKREDAAAGAAAAAADTS
jgi:hypothetical protein